MHQSLMIRLCKNKNVCSTISIACGVNMLVLLWQPLVVCPQVCLALMSPYLESSTATTAMLLEQAVLPRSWRLSRTTGELIHCRIKLQRSVNGKPEASPCWGGLPHKHYGGWQLVCQNILCHGFLSTGEASRLSGVRELRPTTRWCQRQRQSHVIGLFASARLPRTWLCGGHGAVWDATTPKKVICDSVSLDKYNIQAGVRLGSALLASCLRKLLVRWRRTEDAYRSQGTD